ncbi:hypothetical protein RhiirB3_452539 [Rhizophagus irregularis]|nr:hypothetical protein RhiirB3_452539 [Rhizophagus irregularis]
MTLTAICNEEKERRIKEIKERRAKERFNIEQDPKETDESKLEKSIKEYERLEKINNIEYAIIKLLKKKVKNKWKTIRIDSYVDHFKKFDEQLIIEDWGTTDTGKYITEKMISLIKTHDRIETNRGNLLNIESLRKYEGRKTLEKREKLRKTKLEKLYEEINEKNIEINIRKREIYLEEDIGKMLNRILEKKRGKIDMSSLIKREENDKVIIIKEKEKIKEMVYEHYKDWTAERKINLDEIEYNHKWRDLQTYRKYRRANI